MATIRDGGAKTSPQHWLAEGKLPSRRLWAPFDPNFADLLKLLHRHVRPGSKHLEIGFAPGKLLAGAAIKCGANVSGIDYSPSGAAVGRAYFGKIGIAADIRWEDVFATSFPEASFDTVFSNGLIEHFDDPRPIVAKHVAMLAPGGTAIVAIPNYGGLWGRIQKRIDPDNLAIHNLTIMQPEALAALFDHRECEVSASYLGRPSLLQISMARVLPTKIAVLMQLASGALGRCLPSGTKAVAPLIVAVAKKRG